MEEEKTVLEQVDDLQKELNSISEDFDDEDVEDAIKIIIKIIAKPHIPASTAAPLVAKTQALSSKFGLMAKYYMLYPVDLSKEEKTRKKNALMTLSAELEKVSNALKYLVKT